MGRVCIGANGGAFYGAAAVILLASRTMDCLLIAKRLRITLGKRRSLRQSTWMTSSRLAGNDC
jgi:hypothetical protein